MESVNYQYHKLAGYLLFPLRVILLIISLIGFILGNVLLDKLNLNTKQRFTRLCLMYSKICLRIFGIRIYVEGSEYITNDPCIIVGNHINVCDHFVMTDVQQKVPAFIVNKNFNIYPISLLFHYIKSIFCDKTNKTGVVQKMKEYVQLGNQITIYPDACNVIPEGQMISPFKSGAFVPKLPIQPIVIRYVSSSNTNMNWNDNTIGSIIASYLLDGDTRCYVKVLPVQYYKDNYKSHEEYRDDIHLLMTDELKTLPEQRVSLEIREPSSEYTMNALLVIFCVGLLSQLMGHLIMSSEYFLQFIVGYLCHFYPTQNTCDLDILVSSMQVVKTLFLSIQGSYDFYFRSLFVGLYSYQIYKWNQYKYSEVQHLWNMWFPIYIFTCYPFLLQTLELYNVI